MADRVLIADDDADSRNALSLLLSGWGYEVIEATDGLEALDRALECRPTVIVSDLVMPGLDGLALLETLRTELPASSVILLTGHGTGMHGPEAAAALADALRASRRRLPQALASIVRSRL